MTFLLIPQLVKTAKYRGVNPEAVWEYFTEVIAPDVIKWQGQCPHDKFLGDVVFEFAKVAPISKVSIILWTFKL